MTPSQYELGVIALACWRAGSLDGPIGMLAIASIIRNQCDQGWNNGDSYLNAISLPEMAVGWESDEQDLYPDTREPGFNQFLQSLDNVLAGKTRDVTGGGLYYTRGEGGLEHVVCGQVGAYGKLTFHR